MSNFQNTMFFTTFLLTISTVFGLRKLTNSEIAYITSINNLSLGYGAAIWYYKNYLTKILPQNFDTRRKQYETKHGILLPNKLYILCPKSCIIQQYIDNTDYIEHCRELPPQEVCHGGVGNRIYNISVYKIDIGGQFFRCALEYAQPLKHLLTFKEDGKITSKEMCFQRDLFCESLKSMLRDGKNSHETCELIEYDDMVHPIHEVLLDTTSIQEFMKSTKS
ncbi:uncharacterized protein TNIN_335061 [Trichonephila inaurata madagascariensis]|uniref:STING ligand-binding domain-containing protein n=1 Tax=Trichonephila inaurata madagascariensis TaxID=2747483 RepID=A0A8X7C3D0_9ARAC|nr:uncharacterized protein TNIN_335061 [Trichonephila inaurata madagascariensis]